MRTNVVMLPPLSRVNKTSINDENSVATMAKGDDGGGDDDAGGDDTAGDDEDGIVLRLGLT